ncbi:MAG: hypothetical protein PHI12_15065 [Dehalococcoidales bacterium]|jgi:hypothetical protein|nr:hypothetical protein [Dehalococcoidales bacterium]
MIVLGIDPGIRTGYALIDVRSPKEYIKISGGVVKGYPGVDILLSIAPKPEVYVIENFTLWPKLAVKVSHDDPELLTVRYIGALTSHIQRMDVKLVFHQPAYKQGCPDYMLKRYGLWETSQTPHERDAMRHIIVYVRRENAALTRMRQKGRIKP